MDSPGRARHAPNPVRNRHCSQALLKRTAQRILRRPPRHRAERMNVEPGFSPECRAGL